MKQEVESVINKLKELIAECAQIPSDKSVKSIIFDDKIGINIDYKYSSGISIPERLSIDFEWLDDKKTLTEQIRLQREKRNAQREELSLLSQDKNVQRYRELTNSNFINLSTYI